ncbi:MAG: hypothetical protein VKO00_05905 [Cyanobacteriota bacterium]|nr:hypothetical protein [Cyanobacteriota bacterium]
MQAQPLFRTPKRITITIPYSTYQRLLDRSSDEGRSLSNLAAYLLEHHLQGGHAGGSS